MKIALWLDLFLFGRRSPRQSGIAWLLALGALASSHATRGAALPEPDLVLYGVIRNVDEGNARVTAGAMTWTFRPADSQAPITVAALLTNINDQFSYVVRIPCETAIAGFTASAGALLLGKTYDRAEVMVDGQPATFAQLDQRSLVLALNDRGRIERVDLQVAIGGGGLLPDNWQIQYFGHTGVDPFADSDGDGMNNLGEYRSGTHPQDPNSLFSIEITENAPGGPHMQWSSVAGFVYKVQRSRDLLTGFQDLSGNIAATPPLNEYRDPSAGEDPLYFYRLVATRINP